MKKQSKAIGSKVIAVLLIALFALSALPVNARSLGGRDFQSINPECESTVIRLPNLVPDILILPDSVNNIQRGFNIESTVSTEFSSSDLFITDRNILDEIIRLNDIILPEGAILREIVFLCGLAANESIHLSKPAYITDTSSTLFNTNSAAFIANVRRRGNSDSFHYPDTLEVSSLRNDTSVAQSMTESFSKTRSAGWSATAGVNARIVSASVGFSVTDSFTVSRSWTVTVQPRTRVTIESTAYALWYDFNILQNAKGHHFLIGTGNAHRPSGVRLILIERPL